VKSEEGFVVDLLERTGVLVHPGYFFDFEREAFLVLSLLPEPALFVAALGVLFAEIGAGA
jgi:alanine-synthesizing transaminase